MAKDPIQQQIDDAKTRLAASKQLKDAQQHLKNIADAVKKYDMIVAESSKNAQEHQSRAASYRAQASKAAAKNPAQAQTLLARAQAEEAAAQTSLGHVQAANQAKVDATSQLNPQSTTGAARPASDLLRPAADAAAPPAAPTTSPPPAPAPPPAPPVVPTDPRQFQAYLNTLGAGLSVDGIIGPKTRAAAAKYGVALPSNGPAPAPPVTGAEAQTTAGSTSAAPAPLTAVQIADTMKARFGNLGALLDMPDVAKALTDAIRGGLSDDQALNMLRSTPTYQNHQAAELKFLALDANGQQAVIKNNADEITKTATTLGIALTSDRLHDIATNAARFNWSLGSAELSNAIAAEFHYKPGGQTGQIGQAELAIKKMAADYLVPVSDSVLQSYEEQVAAGTATPESFRTYFVNQAKGLFPTMAKQLDQGLTTDQLVDPYRQMASRELQISPDTIDFTQPKWMAALNSPTDPKTGERQMLGLGDWLTKLRSDDTYKWDETVAGKTAYRQAGTAVAQALGLRPGG